MNVGLPITKFSARYFFASCRKFDLSKPKIQVAQLSGFTLCTFLIDNCEINHHH